MEHSATVKGYEIRERIGSGGFGVVHRAFQTTVGREVAIKIILPHFANNPEFIRRFELEAQLVARLEHLHIVPLYDYWRDPEGAYLVMRWMRGGSLRSVLVGGAYDLSDAVRLLDQIASALAMAHRSGVVHRDLKPENILLDEEGNAYLSDFGIATDIRQGVRKPIGTDGAGSLLEHLSPEQARNDPITPQTDIYCLGVLMYELLTGEHPFPNLAPVERMYQHLTARLPLIDTLPDDVTEPINNIIQKATAKNPLQRYADALEMAAAFRKSARLEAGSTPEEQFTRREHEILSLIVKGHTNREIAQQLYVTVGTVKWYVRQIYKKLHVRSRVQAIIRAKELELLTPGTDAMQEIADTESYVLPEPENPYKGLRAFQTADAPNFFGRDKLVQKLIERLAENSRLARFLAVVGPSGSGKSSLVRAGLVPAFWRGALPGSGNWFIIDMSPGAHPLDELEIALTRIAAEQGNNLHENLCRDTRGLVRAANLILPNDDSELVVIVDQLEEIFTLVDDEELRTHFLDLLYGAATDARSRVRIIVTLRADFYDRPLQYPSFGELIQSRMETVLPLSAEDLEAAITQPAERVGVTFEAGLVAQIIGDVHYQPGALPLLQFALTELFEQRKERSLTQVAYQSLGGAVGALATRAEDLYGEHDQAGHVVIRQMFMRLVVPGEEAVDTRRRVPRSELIDIASDDDLMDDVIDTYAAYRLLTLDHDPKSRKPTVEVAHEAILHEWERLCDWLTESCHDIRQQRLLAAEAAQWLQANCDSSYLLRGARLEQFKGWAAETQLALTADERRFLDTSIKEDRQQEIRERERQHQEIETHRQLADRERQAANRLRYLVGGLAIFLVAAVLLTLVALNERNHAEIARNNEQNARTVAEASLRRTDAQRLGLEATTLAEVDGDSDLIALLALRSLNTEYTPQGDHAIQVAMRQSYPLQILVSEQPAQTAQIALSPNGRWLAVAKRSGGVELWDLESNKSVAEFEGGEQVLFLPDGVRLVTANTVGVLRVWNIATKELLASFDDLQGYVRAMTILPNRDLLAISSNSGAVMLIDTNTWREAYQFEAHSELIEALATSADGRWLLTGSGDHEVHLWDLETMRRVRSFDHDGEWVRSVSFSPDGQTIAVSSAAGTVWIWDVDNSDAPRYRISAHAGGSPAIEFAPNGRILVSVGQDKTVRFWDVETGQEARRHLIQPTALSDVTWSADGSRVYVSGSDNFIRVWDAERENTLFSFRSGNHQNHQAFSPTERALAAIWLNGLTIYNLDSGDTARFTYDVMLNAITYTPDGNYLIVGAMSGEVLIIDAHHPEIVRRFVGLATVPPDLALSSNERLLAAGDFQGNLAAWDFQTGEIVFETRFDEAVAALSFSPDGRFLLQSGRASGVNLWDTMTWQSIWSSPLPYGWNDVAISPDGRWFAIGAPGPTLSLWDLETLSHVRDFVGHRAAIETIAFSPDSMLLLSGSLDGSARMWDVTSGVELRRIVEPMVNHVAIAPDGKEILVDNATVATLWSLAIEDSRIDLCQHVTRDFTPEERAFYEIGDTQPTCERFEGAYYISPDS